MQSAPQVIFATSVWRIDFPSTDGLSIDIWLPLIDITEENGCLHYCLGSHRLGRRKHGRKHKQGPPFCVAYDDQDRDQEVKVLAEQGDLILHHNLTVHGSERNTSDRERRAITFPYFNKLLGPVISEEEWGLGLFR